MKKQNSEIRILKFDDCYPEDFYSNKIKKNWAAVERMNFSEYYDWLMKQRNYLSDFFTYPMNMNGWDARELLVRDRMYIKKLIKSGEIKGINIITKTKFRIKFILKSSIATIISYILNPKKCIKYYELQKYLWHIDKYIETFDPHLILVREPIEFDGHFFNKHKSKRLIVSMIGGNTLYCRNWDEHRNDLIYVLTAPYYDYYEALQIPVKYFQYGIDERIAMEVSELNKVHDVTFVGLLGHKIQKSKSVLMNQLAQKVSFKWWGIKGDEIADFPFLEKTWQGEASGIDMYKIYKQSKIVINDYGEVGKGTGLNMRIKEVFAVGSFLLTRYSENLEQMEADNVLVTFKDLHDCIEKIKYFLTHDNEREQIAANGLRFGLNQYNYSDIVKKMMAELREIIQSKQKRIK